MAAKYREQGILINSVLNLVIHNIYTPLPNLSSFSVTYHHKSQQYVFDIIQATKKYYQYWVLLFAASYHSFLLTYLSHIWEVHVCYAGTYVCYTLHCSGPQLIKPTTISTPQRDPKSLHHETPSARFKRFLPATNMQVQVLKDIKYLQSYNNRSQCTREIIHMKCNKIFIPQ